MAGRMRDAKVSGRTPDRVIVVNTGGMAPGGITYNMLNYLTEIAVDGRVAVTVVATIFYDEYMIDMFRKAGCEVVCLPDRNARPLKYFFELCRLLNRAIRCDPRARQQRNDGLGDAGRQIGGSRDQNSPFAQYVDQSSIAAQDSSARNAVSYDKEAGVRQTGGRVAARTAGVRSVEQRGGSRAIRVRRNEQKYRKRGVGVGD